MATKLVTTDFLVAKVQESIGATILYFPNKPIKAGFVYKFCTQSEMRELIKLYGAVRGLPVRDKSGKSIMADSLPIDWALLRKVFKSDNIPTTGQLRRYLFGTCHEPNPENLTWREICEAILLSMAESDKQLRITNRGCVFGDGDFVKLSPQEVVLLRAAEKGGKVRKSQVIESDRLYQIKSALNKKLKEGRVPFKVTGTPTKGYCLISKQA